ncbi:MAG: hypothetical protein K2J63_06140, partial [Muribaculaceae bacterium]|nr:hypothetical protein [Muribaculaceae bacterium]
CSDWQHYTLDIASRQPEKSADPKLVNLVFLLLTNTLNWMWLLPIFHLNTKVNFYRLYHTKKIINTP